ncbi:hypothetical protein AMJ80_09010 [bacterium SM23_31]|nr:MAG: hypothetical protein AMJ80_09010 [bacterium SM23_31]
MWETLVEGGIMMIPLLLCSVLVLALVFDRGFALRRKNVIKPETEKIIEKIQSNVDINMALSLCRENKDTFSNIVNAALETQSSSSQEIKEIIEEQGRQEVRRLEKGLVILETIAGIAPLLGLLGTVLGMIEVFDVITIEGLAKTAALSSGISQALITTVAGLSIGIFALVFYNYFTNKAENLVLEIEKNSSRLLQKIQKF